MKTTRDLLAELKSQADEQDVGGVLKQHIGRPTALSDVPSLDPDATHEMSPMVADRFRFAGEWRNAAPGQTWLNLRQMRTAARSRRVARQIDLRITYWPNSVVARCAKENLSLFGLNEEEYEETYLVWDGSREPRIAVYISNDERLFSNFRKYLLYLVR